MKNKESHDLCELKKSVVLLSIPKSGTHLLANYLRSIFGLENVEGKFIDASSLKNINFKNNKKIYIGHINYTIENYLYLRDSDIILLHRNPQDIVASFARAVFSRTLPKDPLISFILENNFSFDEVIQHFIAGAEFGGAVQPNIRDLYTNFYSKWLPLAKADLMYEKLTLSSGVDNVAIELKELLNRLSIPMPDNFNLNEKIIAASDPKKSGSYVAGGAVQWKDVFSKENIILFNQIFGSNLKNNELNILPITENTLIHKSNYILASDATSNPKINNRLDTIEKKLNRIKNLDDSSHNRVSLLTHECGLDFFVWVDDFACSSLNQTSKDNSYLRKLSFTGIKNVEIKFKNPSSYLEQTHPIYFLVQNALKLSGNLKLIDVGCSYGVESLIWFRMFNKNLGIDVDAYDCGISARLVPHTLNINNLGNQIHFQEIAIGSYDGLYIVYGEYGHAENMRIVNRSEDSENISYVVKGNRLDTLYENLPEDLKLIVKIDVAGGEMEVLKGMTNLIAKNKISGVLIKVSAHALIGLGGASIPTYFSANWRYLLINNYDWVNGSNEPFVDIAASDFPEVFNEISLSESGWAYILAYAPSELCN